MPPIRVLQNGFWPIWLKTPVLGYRVNFCDVTLVSEGHQQKEAYKNILSATSPFFGDILMTNKHSHPLIYMRGIKDSYLIAIINFVWEPGHSVN